MEAQKELEKLHIETWGCQMNVADSEKMASFWEEITLFVPKQKKLT